MLRLAYRLVDCVVSVSEGQAAWLLEAGLVPPEKLVVIQSSVDCAELLRVGLPDRDAGPIRLAAYGRYCRQKGFDVLIEAMRKLPPEMATLAIAGYGPDRAALEQAAAGLPNVRIGGPVQRIDQFLSEFDAVVVPSRWEAFGLVALEARAAGRPLIVSDVDGLTEQVTPETGLVAAADDADALARSIADLVDRDHARMGLAGRATASLHFDRHLRDWQTLIGQVASAYTTKPNLMQAAQ